MNSLWLYWNKKDISTKEFLRRLQTVRGPLPESSKKNGSEPLELAEPNGDFSRCETKKAAAWLRGFSEVKRG